MKASTVGVGVALIAALSFWVGRQSASPGAPPILDPRLVVATWDGGVLLTADLESWLAHLPAGAASQPRAVTTAALARSRLLASVARDEKLDDKPLVRQQCDELLIEELRKAHIVARQPTDAELKAAWEADTRRFREPESVRLGLIQLAPDTPDAGVEQVFSELRARMKTDFYAFSDVAQRKSIDPQSRTAGGELGPLAVSDVERLLGADLTRELVGLPPGALLPRIASTQRGPAIVKLIEYRAESVTPFARVSDSVRARLIAERATADWEAFVARLEADRGLVVLP